MLYSIQQGKIMFGTFPTYMSHVIFSTMPLTQAEELQVTGETMYSSF